MRKIKIIEIFVYKYHQSGQLCAIFTQEVRDVSRKLPSLIQLFDNYPLLIVQASNSEAAERSLRSIKRDFRALGQLVDRVGIQFIFSSVPSMAGRNTKRSRKPFL